jgi:predicted DNA-binding ribbon-helix-helix protein
MLSALKQIARREICALNDLCSLIHLRKQPGMTLTSAVRVFVMLYYRAAATDEGHQRAGHAASPP